MLLMGSGGSTAVEGTLRIRQVMGSIRAGLFSPSILGNVSLIRSLKEVQQYFFPIKNECLEQNKLNKHSSGFKKGSGCSTFFACSTGPRSNNFVLMLGSNSVRFVENRDRGRTFVYFVQITHRRRGEKKKKKKKERRIGVDSTSCTGTTEKPGVEG